MIVSPRPPTPPPPTLTNHLSDPIPFGRTTCSVVAPEAEGRNMIHFRGSMCRKAEEMDYPHLCGSYRVHSVFPAAFSVPLPPVSQIFPVVIVGSSFPHGACNALSFLEEKKPTQSRGLDPRCAPCLSQIDSGCLMINL